jgi:Icc-related predicted phosphoesterase
MKGISNRFFYKCYSYIKVYGTTGASHLLPYFVPGHFLMREISYQTMGSRVNALLQINNKTLWPIFLIHIGSYTISNRQHARKEEESLKELIICLGDPKGHDPHELASIHVRYVGLTNSNIHVVDFEEDTFKGTISYDEVPHHFPHEYSKRELENEQEEIKRETLNHFHRLLE